MDAKKVLTEVVSNILASKAPSYMKKELRAKKKALKFLCDGILSGILEENEGPYDACSAKYGRDWDDSERLYIRVAFDAHSKSTATAEHILEGFKNCLDLPIRVEVSRVVSDAQYLP